MAGRTKVREMYLIAALGNPGREYELTRHNAGFMTADAFCGIHGFSCDKERFYSLCGETRVGAEKVLLIKPQTYMNLSGIAVRAAADYYRIDPEHIIVIHDDIEFPMGELRIRRGGGPGTHNGMKSVVSSLATTKFPRIRFGVGDNGSRDLRDYVLSPFTSEELEIMKSSAEKAAQAIDCYISEGIDSAMNKFNPRRIKKAPVEGENKDN